MGKTSQETIHRQKHHLQECGNFNAPICDCPSNDGVKLVRKLPLMESNPSLNRGVKQDPAFKKEEEDIKELLVIGAGPHSLTVLLRLLEPEPDFMSEKERHYKALKTKKLRPMGQVRRHVEKLSRGPSVVLRSHKTKSKPHKDFPPPPLKLDTVQRTVAVIDCFGEWLGGWKDNFAALRIPRLRSLMNAHADPYDHRSMEYYAEYRKRGDELVTLPELVQRDKNFDGPYQVPTTSIFEDFHDALIRAYGVGDMVQKGKVVSIRPLQNTITNSSIADEAIFEVQLENAEGKSKVLKTKRVVCAMGPSYSTTQAPWEASLQTNPTLENYKDKILHADEIVPWLKAQRHKQHEMNHCASDPKRLLIVGGGITSVQLALLASQSEWCSEVTFLQRSKSLSRQFDVETKWFGSARGRLLEEFWLCDSIGRLERLRDARRGGSIPPELLKELESKSNHCAGKLTLREEVEITKVCWEHNHLVVILDDNDESSELRCDRIWLATGSENHLDNYVALNLLRETLPIQSINGLPILDSDLSWKLPDCHETGNEEEEPAWKQQARKRCFVCGVLAALELGPDALNLVGARHGAVRIAKAIRSQMCENGAGME